MAKKKKPEPAKGPEFERIEIQVPKGFTAQVDAAAARVGLSRSAYIRQATLLKIRQDKADWADFSPEEGGGAE
jgi:hypothetical protein